MFAKNNHIMCQITKTKPKTHTQGWIFFNIGYNYKMLPFIDFNGGRRSN